MENALETTWVGLEVGWGRASESHQGGANSVSHIDEVSDMAPVCQLCGSVRVMGTSGVRDFQFR